MCSGVLPEFESSCEMSLARGACTLAAFPGLPTTDHQLTGTHITPTGPVTL